MQPQSCPLEVMLPGELTSPTLDAVSSLAGILEANSSEISPSRRKLGSCQGWASWASFYHESHWPTLLFFFFEPANFNLKTSVFKRTEFYIPKPDNIEHVFSVAEPVITKEIHVSYSLDWAGKYRDCVIAKISVSESNNVSTKLNVSLSHSLPLTLLSLSYKLSSSMGAQRFCTVSSLFLGLHSSRQRMSFCESPSLWVTAASALITTEDHCCLHSPHFL